MARCHFPAFLSEPCEKELEKKAPCTGELVGSDLPWTICEGSRKSRSKPCFTLWRDPIQHPGGLGYCCNSSGPQCSLCEGTAASTPPVYLQPLVSLPPLCRVAGWWHRFPVGNGTDDGTPSPVVFTEDILVSGWEFRLRNTSLPRADPLLLPA